MLWERRIPDRATVRNVGLLCVSEADQPRWQLAGNQAATTKTEANTREFPRK